MELRNVPTIDAAGTTNQEAGRLAAIADYELGDSIPEPDLDRIVALAAELFDASAAISIATPDLTYSKARSGREACKLDPHPAFRSHSLDREEALVIEDAYADPRFTDDPLVAAGNHARFYAGTPLQVATGHVLGALCVIDSEPRSFSDRDRRLLRSLGEVVISRLETRRHERRLARLAHFDALTKLPNRALLYQRAGEVLARGSSLAVLVFDLDGFKEVNDLFGHPTGDALLCAIGERLSGLLTGDQMLARLGGDEFVVLAPDVGDPRAAWVIADRLRAAFNMGFLVNKQELRLDTCIGMALSPYHGDTIDTLVCHADLALYRAKKRGSGSITFFEPHLQREIESRQKLQHELHCAFERGEFELFYQPQIRLSDQAIVGVEALLRWRHPDHGLLTPAQFLPILELMPLAARVGGWAVDTAIAQAARLSADGQPLRVGINLFASQFRSGSLRDEVAASLARHRVAPELIELELTEDLAVRNMRCVIQTLKALRDLGVGIALDDFGTGYASLSVLRDFPITRLKIDRRFVADIAAETDRTPTLDSMLTLGRAFNLSVSAKGVEHPAQARWLRANGCDEVQGWLYGKPIRPSELEQLTAVTSVATRKRA
ncbi:MAG: putative bifunctional diguanylate cyclase/phosphodiesterase [Janthinobacterium lividum]